jgi:hypothetical protein
VAPPIVTAPPLPVQSAEPPLGVAPNVPEVSEPAFRSMNPRPGATIVTPQAPSGPRIETGPTLGGPILQGPSLDVPPPPAVTPAPTAPRAPTPPPTSNEPPAGF